MGAKETESAQKEANRKARQGNREMRAESKSQVARFRAQSGHYDAGYKDGHKAGYEAGLRRASEIADATEAEFLRESTLPDLTGTYSKHCAACASGAGSVEVAILAEIKGE